jgi:glycosyltransferase involved in cell wall biosynthesis/SAM-dependent methyltransferase
MKLNWFSPLPPAKSDIANYTLRVLPDLSERAQLVLWTAQSDWDREIEEYATVRHYQLDSMPWSEIHQADLNVYHIGNNALHHSEIWQVSQRCAGLVILHDGRLQHFFTSLYEGNRQGYLSQMQRYYGEAGKQACQDYWRGLVSIEQMAEHYPLTLLALKNSVGAIVHNPHVYEQLQLKYPKLTGCIPLPYQRNLQIPGPEKRLRHSPPYQLIIFGHIGTNRRIESVLDALAACPQKNSFKLDIYGELWDETHVKEYISQLNLEEQVAVRGFVPEAELETALAQADLAINLRYPSMGEASGSQLRIWSHALPSLVTQTEWYASLPPDTVAFVRPDRESKDIQQHLQDFLDNPASYREMGQKGRHHLEREHHPEIYDQSLLEIAAQARSLRHRSLLDYLSDRVGREVSYWQLTNASQAVLPNIAGAMSYLLDGKLRMAEALAPVNGKISSKKAIESAYVNLFQSYEFYQGEWAEYVQTHLKRYLATLELIPQKEGLHILELGSSYAFSLMLKQAFPDACISLATHPDENQKSNIASEIELKSISEDHPNYYFPCAQFNMEKDPWPFADRSFDVVLSMEILEHLLLNPWFSFREANRVLKDGGSFILTTPNIARYESVASLLQGGSPYTFGIYSKYGPYGRHNREYVPGEVLRLGECCGFRTDLITTQDVYPVSLDIGPVKELLSQSQDDPKMRKQTILYRGIKTTEKIESYPTELYDFDPCGEGAKL